MMKKGWRLWWWCWFHIARTGGPLLLQRNSTVFVQNLKKCKLNPIKVTQNLIVFSFSVCLLGLCLQPKSIEYYPIKKKHFSLHLQMISIEGVADLICCLFLVRICLELLDPSEVFLPLLLLVPLLFFLLTLSGVADVDAAAAASAAIAFSAVLFAFFRRLSIIFSKM